MFASFTNASQKCVYLYLSQKYAKEISTREDREESSLAHRVHMYFIISTNRTRVATHRARDEPHDARDVDRVSFLS